MACGTWICPRMFFKYWAECSIERFVGSGIYVSYVVGLSVSGFGFVSDVLRGNTRLLT